MKQLILVRGLPGSGKSTLADILVEGFTAKEIPAIKVEDDMYFINKTTKQYQYVANQVPDAEQWCLDSVDALLDAEKIIVVVSNCFLRLRDMTPYLKQAKAHEASVQIYECKGRYGSIHPMGIRDFQGKIEAWEEIPMYGFWGRKVDELVS